MRAIVNRHKGTIVIAVTILSFVFANPAQAIIVGAPLIAISILKLTAFFVSALAVPLTVMINIVKKDTKKSLFIAFIVLAVLFASVYFALSNVVKLQGPVDYKMQNSNFYQAPSNFKALELEKQDFTQDSPKQGFGYQIAAPSITGIAITYFLYSFVGLSFPTLAVLYVISKRRLVAWEKKRLLSLWVTLTITMAVIISFTFTVLYWINSTNGYLY